MIKPYDVAIVGGAGHIGAPLAILLASKGLRTLVYDVNVKIMAKLSAGEFPFCEEGAQALLQEALAQDMLGFTAEVAQLRGVPYLVISIGTPIDEFHNPVLRGIYDCMDSLLPHLSDEQTLILRSTVFPGVTDSLVRRMRSQGKSPRLAFCPERVVQGQAIREMQTLPQIVAGTTPEADDAAAALFSRIAPKIIHMIPVEAEFAKLICNAYRYIQFAAANQFYTMAESAGLNYPRILAGLKQDYQRARDLPGPGFAAGPCLMKDTMQLLAFSNNNFLLGNIAMIVNEGLPNFLIDNLRKRYDLTVTRVGILGMAFKSDIDDNRDSLSYKLAKILRFNSAQVMYSDEFIQDPSFISKEKLLASCDVVFIGAPHSAYRKLLVPDGVELIDLWQVVEAGRSRSQFRFAA